MLEYSVLLVHRGPAGVIREQLAELYPVLEQLAAPFEILLVDDGSSREDREPLETLSLEWPRLRILWIDPASGPAAALKAGVAAARGKVLIRVGRGYAAAEIPRLLGQLSRADLVHGRRRRGRIGRWRRAFETFPERLLLGAEVRDPDCRFWAARREALVELPLDPGMDRYLAWLVALAGYRVIETGVSDAPRVRTPLAAGESRWGDLISVWWKRRRRKSYTVTEVAPRPARLEVLSDDEIEAREAA